MQRTDVITPPLEDDFSRAFPLESLRAHARLDEQDDDASLLLYLRSAFDHLNGPNGLLGRSILPQTLRTALDCFPAREIWLPFGPVSAVLSISYLDVDGQQQVIDPAISVVLGLNTLDGALIVPTIGADWPSTAALPGAVNVTFTAGWPATEVPEAIRLAVFQRSAWSYSMRESAYLSTALARAAPHASDETIAAYRVWNF